MEQNYLAVCKLLIALVVVPRSILTVKTLARSHKATRRYIRTIVDITSF
jgi:hypothetical protein